MEGVCATYNKLMDQMKHIMVDLLLLGHQMYIYVQCIGTNYLLLGQ